MTKILISVLLLAAGTTLAIAQTQLHVSNLTITEKGQTLRGTDVTASLRGAQGKQGIVLYADQRHELSGKFKVKTHKVRRQSVKQGAVYLTMYMDLRVDGKKNRRVVQKTFYAEQDRTARFEEAFLIKRGIDVRKITVAFDGRIE